MGGSKSQVFLRHFLFLWQAAPFSSSLPPELQVCRVSLPVSVGSLTRWLVVHSVPTSWHSYYYLGHTVVCYCERLCVSKLPLYYHWYSLPLTIGKQVGLDIFILCTICLVYHRNNLPCKRVKAHFLKILSSLYQERHNQRTLKPHSQRAPAFHSTSRSFCLCLSLSYIILSVVETAFECFLRPFLWSIRVLIFIAESGGLVAFKLCPLVWKKKRNSSQPLVSLSDNSIIIIIIIIFFSSFLLDFNRFSSSSSPHGQPSFPSASLFLLCVVFFPTWRHSHDPGLENILYVCVCV